MNNDERNDFYIALNNLHDNNPDNIKYMLSKINLPDVLCRFRNVTQSSLEQLQENKVFYSSADHYDDPFDTYLRFDHNRIKLLYSFLSSVMNEYGALLEPLASVTIAPLKSLRQSHKNREILCQMRVSE